MTSLDFSTILPEVVLAAYALAALMAGAYLGKDRLASTLLWTTVAAFLVVAAMVGLGGRADQAGQHRHHGQENQKPPCNFHPVCLPMRIRLPGKPAGSLLTLL